jgi:homeobox protein cut-like
LKKQLKKIHKKGLQFEESLSHEQQSPCVSSDMEETTAVVSTTAKEPVGSVGNQELDSVLQFWKQFDIMNTRNVWDKTCNEMREMKTASITGRKRLNDLTKVFRAKPKEEQANSISELLKAYQEEIDQLSRRTKLSETAYLGIYKSLYDAPDPAFYLDQITSSLFASSSHLLEIQRLKSELSQYDEEFRRLKNQEVTIRRLEDQLQEFKENNEVKIIEEVEKRVSAIKQECEQEVFESKELQKSMERRLSVALETAKQSQVSADRAQVILFFFFFAVLFSDGFLIVSSFFLS